MEKSENTYEQAKRKAQIGSAGGGNIGGLVVAGGALAVASLVAAVAAFAVHRGRKRGGNEISSRRRKKEDQTNRGLRFILQNSPPTFDCNPRCASDESINMVATQIDSCELDSTQSLILEENPASAINCRNEISSSEYDQEILLTDDSKQDSIKSFNHHSGIEEFSLSMLDNIKNDSGEELPLMEVIEVTEEEIEMDAVKRTSLMHSVEEEGNDEKDEEMVVVEETKEEFSLVERIEVIKVEETMDSVEISAEKNSSMLSAEEEEEEKESPSIKRIEVWNEEEAIDDASKMSAEITSMLSVIEKEYENDSNEEDGNKESAIEKDEGNSEGTESSSAGSNAEEIWPVESVEELSQELKDTPQHSVAKIVEEQQTTITEECSHFHNGKIDMLRNCRNDHQTTQNSMLLNKEETLEFIGLTDQPMWLTKWRVWARHVLVLALMVLLLFAHRNGLSLDLVIGRTAGHNL